MGKVVKDSHIIGEAGVSAFTEYCIKHRPVIVFRPVGKSDFGIDGEVELTSNNEHRTNELMGEIIKVQIKSTASAKSYIRSEQSTTFDFQPKQADIEYWRKLKENGLDVLLVIYDGRYNNNNLYCKRVFEEDFNSGIRNLIMGDFQKEINRIKFHKIDNALITGNNDFVTKFSRRLNRFTVNDGQTILAATNKDSMADSNIIGDNKVPGIESVVNLYGHVPAGLKRLIDILEADSHNILRNIRSRVPNIKNIDKDPPHLQNHGNFNFREEYDAIANGIKMLSIDDQIKYKLNNAATCMRKLEFGKVYQILGESLEIINPSHRDYDDIYKEYLISGFIWYSSQNDIDALWSLILKKSEKPGSENPDIEYIFSMISQEIFTRKIDLDGLRNVVSSLDNLYKDANKDIKAAMAHSLGLAYRRLGERTGIPSLEKAICIFKEGLELSKNDNIMQVELKDQMAISHIRIFESNKEGKQLELAEELLKKCLKLLEGPINPKYYHLRPRVLNNYGNIHKQKTFLSKDIASARSAISFYEQATKYWNEKDASYDWAMLIKNIAETKYALGMISNNNSFLLEAIKKSIRSTKYRTLKDSPYQWGKSVEITFLVIIFLDKQKVQKLISKPIRIKILSYIDSVISDESKWSDNLSSKFVQNARHAQEILL